MKTLDRRSLSVIVTLLLVVVAIALAYDLVIIPRFNTLISSSLQFGQTSGANQRWGPAQGPFGARGLSVLVRALAGITATVGVGSAALFFVPHQLTATVAALDQYRGRTLIIGIATVVGGVLLAALAVVSVAAAVFAPLIVLTLLVTSAWGLLAVALHIGRWLRSRLHGEPNLSTDLVIGVLVLALVALLPFVGRIALVVAACWGVGAVVRTHAGYA